MKTTKPKKAFLDGYKTYDPKVEGYGSPEEWRSTFKERMSQEEATEYLKDNDPYKILNVKKDSPLDVIKKAFRKLALLWHPDKNPNNVKESTKRMQGIIAAYTVIMNKLKDL